MNEWVLSGLAWSGSTVFGGLVTYGYNYWHDNQKEKRNARANLISTCYSVCFTLALQLSELGGLLEDIKYRIKNLAEIKQNPTPVRDQVVTVLQDFYLFKELKIDIMKVNELLLLAGGDKRGSLEGLQSIFISNKKYFKIVMTIEHFNEVKRFMNKDADTNRIRDDLLDFADENLIQYQNLIERDMQFINQSLEAFKAMLNEKYDVAVNLSMGETIELS